MRARPHHLIDIITQHGAGQPFEPSAYGHAVHTVAAEVLADPDVLVEFGTGADDICRPCVHLANGRCDDLVRAFDPPVSKHDYNDALDRRLMAFLGMVEGQVMSFRDYVALLRSHIEGLSELCAWPGEPPAERRRKLEAGLLSLQCKTQR